MIPGWLVAIGRTCEELVPRAVRQRVTTRRQRRKIAKLVESEARDIAMNIVVGLHRQWASIPAQVASYSYFTNIDAIQQEIHKALAPLDADTLARIEVIEGPLDFRQCRRFAMADVAMVAHFGGGLIIGGPRSGKLGSPKLVKQLLAR